MSDRQHENALRIADYLGNKLSPEEKETFKHALGEDDQLRLQYIDALMNRARGGTDTEGIGGADTGPAGMGAAGWALAGTDSENWTPPDRGGETHEDREKVLDQEMSVLNNGGAAGMGELEEIVRESGVGESSVTPDVGSDAAPSVGSDTGNSHVRTGVEDAASPASPGGHGGEQASGEWGGRAVAATRESGSGEREEGAGHPAAANAAETEETQAPLVTEVRWRDGAGRVPPEDGGGRWAWLGKRWMVILAALLILAGAVVIYMMKGHRGWWTDSETRAVAGSGSGSANDSTTVAGGSGTAAAGTGSGTAAAGKAASDGASANGSGSAGAAGAKADSIYARLYKPYMRGDDPAEVRMYYRDYKEGNYSAVLARGDSVKGAGVRALLVRDYMRLYVGLSYMATDSAREAVTELEGVVLRTKPGDILYENARWYLALAWLKRKDVDASEAVGRSLGLAREIAESYSRFRDQARALVKALGS